MTPRPSPSSDGLRIGDAEREQAAAELADHYAQGRLDRDEHAERLDLVWAARTRAELTPVFADLPRPGHTAPSRAGTSRSAGSRQRLPVPVVVVLAVLAAIAVVAHLPLVLIGAAVWFFAFRGCAARRPHRARWHG